MASNLMPNGNDLNDKSTLDLYFQIRSFQSDDLRDKLLFENQSRSDRLKIHTIAESLDMEYEYSTNTKLVRISRTAIPQNHPFAPDADLDLFDDTNDWLPQYETSKNNTCAPEGDLDLFDDTNDWLPHHDVSMQDFVLFSPDIDRRNADQRREESLFGSQPMDTCDVVPDLALLPLNLTQGLEKSYNARMAKETAMGKDLRGGNHPSLVTVANRVVSPLQFPDPPRDSHLDLFTREEGTEELRLGSMTNFSFSQHEDQNISTHVENSLFCTYEGCERGRPGYGFSNRGLLDNHIKQGHDSLIQPSSASLNKFVGTFSAFGYISENSSAHSDATDMTCSSGRSGRTGPLSDLARAGMRAVKKIGACWRCIFLRKKCGPETPCLICPKGGRSNWEALGCHRGDFKTRTIPVRLCPSLCMKSRVSSFSLPARESSSCKVSEERELWANRDEDIPNASEGVHMRHFRTLFIDEFADACDGLTIPPDPALLQPLRYCMMCIAWEVLQTPDSLCALGDGPFKETVGKISQLLPFASVYQATFDGDQLIAQSLICPRSCLELLRNRDLLTSDNHRSCQYSRCCCDSIRDLQVNLTLYLDELSRVFFKKSNLRDRTPSWLSIFYSFCIQSLVRKALVRLVAILPGQKTTNEDMASSQYLYLPLRLFNASSAGSKDVLFPDECLGTDSKTSEYYERARRAVDYDEWYLTGMITPADYLKKLFQDHGQAIKLNPDMPQDIPSLSDNKMRKVGTVNKKIQRVNAAKCQPCGSAKTRCLPIDRVWPQKCYRCSAKQLGCTGPTLHFHKADPAPKPAPAMSGYESPRGSSISGSSMGSCSSLRYEITDWGDPEPLSELLSPFSQPTIERLEIEDS